MSTLEDQLRDVMTDRAAHLPAQAEPYEGVHRLIARTRRRRAVAGVTAVALAAVGVASLGLTISVDCGGGPGALVVRVNGRWFTEHDCDASGPAPAIVLLAPGEMYRRYGVRTGGSAVIEATDVAPGSVRTGKRAWSVRVDAALQLPVRVEPAPTALPSWSAKGLLGSLSASATAPNGVSGVLHLLAPAGGTKVAVICVSGTVRVEVHDVVTHNASFDTVHCTSRLPAPPGLVLTETESPGHAFTVRVTSMGFTHPTWRVDVLARQP